MLNHRQGVSVIAESEFTPFELDDKYIITGLLAHGGMGEVFVGETKLVHHKVAVKILHAELVKQADMLMRFKLEAEIASSLNHPNIVNVCGSGVTPDGKPYLAMDYVEGQNLEALIRSCPDKIDTRVCLNILHQLAKAVAYSHEKSIIHRDLKPSNVMLQDDGSGGYVVKLLDFGIAKAIPVGDTVARELTLPGHVFGSVLYMSPEQILGKNVDFRSDIYSFGCLMFHTIAGKPPYNASSPVDCMQMHVDESIPNIAEYLPGNLLADSIARIVSTCMRKDPSQRFETSHQLEAAIERLCETSSAEPVFAPGASAAESGELSGKASRLSKDDMLSVVTILIIAVCLTAVPYFYNLDLPKAQSAKDAANSPKKPTVASADEAIVLTTKKVDSQLEEVDAAIKQKNLGEAEKLARTAYLTSLSLSPDNPKIADALFALGQVFELSQNYQGAMQAYNWTLSFRQAKFGPMAPQTEMVQQRISEVQRLMAKPAVVQTPPHIEAK